MMRRGFNLMEVLVAIALILALSGTMYGFLHQLMQSREQAARHGDRQRAANLLIDHIRADLATCIVGSSETGAGVLGRESSLVIAARAVPASLASRGSEDPAVFSDLHQSTYRFDSRNKQVIIKRNIIGDSKSASSRDQNGLSQQSTRFSSQFPPTTQSAGNMAEPFAPSSPQDLSGWQDSQAGDSASLSDGTIGSSPDSPIRRNNAHSVGAEFYKVRFRYHNGRTWQKQFNSLQAEHLPVAVEVAIWFDPWPSETQQPSDDQSITQDRQQSEQSTRLTFDDTAGFDERAEAFASDFSEMDIPDPDRVAVLIVPDASKSGSTSNSRSSSQQGSAAGSSSQPPANRASAP